MALRNISLNAKLVFIVIIFFSIPQFMKSDTKVNYHVLNYTGLVPVHYDVAIELDFHRNVLFGECNITINITRQMSNMSVPSINFGILQIDMINEKDNQIINVPIYSFINETQLYIDFTNSSVNALVPGTYILQMIYVRNIFDNETFFGPLYEEKGGVKVLTETGVEVIKAQQIFPCWNDLTFETTFTISIKHDQKYTALSNMLIKRKEYENESYTMWTHFVKSPSMSIQNLTIVIMMTTLKNIHSFVPAFHDNLSNVTFWYRINTYANLRYALDIFYHIMFLLKENSVPTKIPKMDYVAFWDVQHSNIETWGLILHRKEDIIYNKTLNSIEQKIKVANLVAHQIISVWFHDVMPIEGFATYFAAYILEKMEDLNYMEHLFVVQIQQESFRFEIPSNTNLTLYNSDLSVEVNKTIPYYLKPSILWRVLRHFLKDEVFYDKRFWYFIRKIYALRHKQSSEAKLENLWNYVQNNIDNTRKFPQFNLTKYINNWIRKNYYPVLYVVQNYTTNTLLFSYLSSGYIDKDVEQLPALITYRNETGNDGAVWLSPRETKNIGFNQTDHCIIVNVEQKGYYRVHYDYENWRKIAQYLNDSSVHVLNQAQIVDDAFHFLIHKQLDIIVFWNLVSFLSENTNYVAWYPMFKAFEYMACIFSFDNLTEYLTQNMKKILNGVLQKVGYNEKEDEKDLIKCLREEAAKWACILGVPECRRTATLQLIEDLKNHAPDNSFTWKEEWKYCKGLMSANNSVWDSTLHKYENNSNNRILEYLTCSEDPFIINIYLNHTSKQNENTSYIKEQNKRVNVLLFSVAKHARHNMVLDFILQRLESQRLQLTGDWQSDTIVILIVTITHNYSALNKVSIFASSNLKKEQLIDAVKKKIRRRRLEYRRQIANYKTLLQYRRK